MASVVAQTPHDGESPDSQPDLSDEFAELGEAAWSCLQQLARAMRVDEADLQSTLYAIASSSTGTISAVEAAGINLLDNGKFLPQAVYGDAPPILDSLQQRTGRGPCIDASRDQKTIEISAMKAEGRWPEFAQRAVELDVQSMLCLPLWIDDRTLGSLSLYAHGPWAFDDTARGLAELFATHAALAIGDAQRTTRLRRAMSNRDVIGQAKGVLMERHHITADEAFRLLAEASKQANRKVVDIAEEIATTGRHPANEGPGVHTRNRRSQ